MRTRNRVVTLVILLAAYSLRVFRLGAQELRGDEAFGYFFSQRPYWQIISDTLALQEPHPVLSYFVRKTWIAVAGSSEFSLRYTGVLFSVAAVALLYRLAIEVRLPARIAMIAALLVAVSPYAVWHSQDARMYSMSMALTLGSTLLAMIWLHNPKLSTGVEYVAVSLVALHTHYFAAFIVLAQSLFVISQVTCGRSATRTAWRWVLVQLVLWALYAPWLLRVRDTLTGYHGNGDSPALAEALVRSLSVVATGEAVPVTQRAQWAALALLAAGLGALSLAALHRYRPAAWLFGLYLAVPVFGAWYGAQSRPIFDERYLAAAAPPFFALAAASLMPLAEGPGQGRRSGRQRVLGVLGAVLIVALLVGSGQSLTRYYASPAYSKTRGWRELATSLQHLSACLPLEQTKLIQNYPDPTLWYYFQGPPGHIVLPPVAHDEALARGEVGALVKEGVRWALFISQPAPNWDAGDIGSLALGEEFSLAATDRSTNWPISIYVRPSAEIGSGSTQFENGVELAGHSVAPVATAPGGIVVANINWDLTGLDGTEPVTAFVQMIDELGRLVAQEDRPLPLTHDFTSENLTVDSYGILLPHNLPPGKYHMISGLYRPDFGGERILTAGGADHVVLHAVTVGTEELAGCGPAHTESDSP